jgi:hypothetical protein
MNVVPKAGWSACAPPVWSVFSCGAPLKGWYGPEDAGGARGSRVPAHSEHSEIHFDVALSGLCALCRNATQEQPM